MVKTRIDLQVKLQEWVMNQEQFTTNEAVNYAREIAPNINTSAMRIVNYIKRFAKFENKVWTKPEIKVND